MTHFLKHRRPRNVKEGPPKEGLGDATNFPLLSSKWMKGSSSENQHANNFLSRRLMCFGGGHDAPSQASPLIHKVQSSKAISPPKDVASTWVQMGSETSDLDRVAAVSSSSCTRGKEQTGTVTTQKDASRRVEYCGSRRISESRSVSRPRAQTSAHNSFTSNSSKPSSSSQHSRFAGQHVRPSSRNVSRTTSSRSSKSSKPPKYKSMAATDWKSAVDPKSGRTYYYNAKTRETQWRKPMELASPAERSEMEAKERKQKEFFAAMEANILKSIAQGQVPGTPKPETHAKGVVAQPTLPAKSLVLEKPRMVRTISGMDDTILKELVKRVPSLRIKAPMNHEATVHMPREDSMGMDDLNRIHDEGHLSGLSESAILDMEMTLRSMDFEDMTDTDSPSAREENMALQQLAKTAQEMTLVSSSAVATKEKKPVDTSPPQKQLTKPTLEKPSTIRSRRNTCGTIYVGSTMSAPDKDATIKVRTTIRFSPFRGNTEHSQYALILRCLLQCVCGVYRAHIMSSAKEQGRSPLHIGGSSKYRIFNDRECDRVSTGTVQEDKVMEDLSLEEIAQSVPSLDEISNFYRDIFRRSQMESDCIIMSLIYVERLIKVTDGGLRPCTSNWRSLLFSCMILSSKVWDDLSMWNADFSQTCPAGVRFSLQRINELEIAVLNALEYKVKVPASEYAKYYFLLRSMLIKSGLGGDDIKTMTPLDVEGAKKLEQVSSSFQSTAATRRRVAKEDKLRSKSMGDVEVAQMMAGAKKSQDAKASLEHMVKM